VTLLARQLRYEQRIFWRTPATMFFTLAFPMLMLVIFVALSDDPTFAPFFVPSMAMFGVLTTCYGNVVARVVLRRETGLLRRVRATPLPAAIVVGGLLANAVVVSALLVALVIAAGALLYGVAPPSDVVALIATVTVGGAAFCALGIAASTWVPNVDTADPVVFATLMPVAFVSGVFMPLRDGTLLARLAAALPVRHLVEAGAGRDPWPHLAAVAAWGVAGTLVAVRRFRWAPSTA
jgi:ABC-2 type transport system permease protein